MHVLIVFHVLQKLWSSTTVLTDYTWVAITPWEFHYGPSLKSLMETIAICNEGANVLHLVMSVSFWQMDLFYGIVSWK